MVDVNFNGCNPIPVEPLGDEGLPQTDPPGGGNDNSLVQGTDKVKKDAT
jgi:hypothetical protein